MNKIEASNSCVPSDPCHGKRGESIQSSSGIMTMRLSVMELGRFKCSPKAGVGVLPALSALYAPVDCEAVLFHVEQFRPCPPSISQQIDLSDLACFPVVGFAEN